MNASRIDTVPGLKQTFAEAYAEGATQGQLCELAGVKDRGTVAEWLKRSDVQALVQKAVIERGNRITRHTSHRIEQMLINGKKMSVETLLKIHREFAPNSLNLTVGADSGTALQELFMAAHDDPQIAEALKSLAGEGDSEDGDEPAA